MEEYRRICIKYGLFTEGSNEQYRTVGRYFEYVCKSHLKPSDTLYQAVIYMTWICSDRNIFTTLDITRIFTKEL